MKYRFDKRASSVISGNVPLVYDTASFLKPISFRNVTRNVRRKCILILPAGDREDHLFTVSRRNLFSRRRDRARRFRVLPTTEHPRSGRGFRTTVMFGFVLPGGGERK